MSVNCRGCTNRPESIWGLLELPSSQSRNAQTSLFCPIWALFCVAGVLPLCTPFHEIHIKEIMHNSAEKAILGCHVASSIGGFCCCCCNFPTQRFLCCSFENSALNLQVQFQQLCHESAYCVSLHFVLC